MESKVEELLSRAYALHAKFQQDSEDIFIDEAISLDREALAICTSGHPQRFECLSQLSSHLYTLYKLCGGEEDIDEAIDLAQEVLLYSPPGHADRTISLQNLANRLHARYEQAGNVEDIHEAIALNKEAMEIFPPEDPDRWLLLNSQAGFLLSQYSRLGAIEDLSKAIIFNRQALVLCPEDHPDWWLSSNNLSGYLFARYQQLGADEDLNDAIHFSSEAISHCPPGSPDLSMALNNLAAYLFARFGQCGGIEDVNQAIVLNRKALVLRPVGHPNRPMSLENLAMSLCARYEQLGGAEDLDEAIILARESFELRPPGHPERSSTLTNLAGLVCTRYEKLGGVDDLSEAISLQREALELQPRGHPDRSQTLRNLTSYLSDRYQQLGREEDQEEMFTRYNELAPGTNSVSLEDLSAAKEWIASAEFFHHPTALLAYQTALGMLVRYTAILPSLPHHLAMFKSQSSSLAIDAFSACIRNGSLMGAVELLEQGRGVFWSQLTRLRSSLDDVTTSGSGGKALADEFTRLTSLIRDNLESPGEEDQHEEVWQLNLELERVVSDIRGLPGHSRFLLPPLFSDLRHAASGGPVIILNASQYGCDALVVSMDNDPVHVSLSIEKKDVRELSSKLRELVQRGKREDVSRDLTLFLRELWDKVVSPIAEVLLTPYPTQTRVWWCPTAEFSLLPLHAANPFRTGQKGFSDRYISSYTPTLSALVRARSSASSTSGSDPQRFIAIGQADASGTSKLLSVCTELENIGQRISSIAAFTQIEGADACISRVTEELSKNQWVHLACHGIANRKEPFESAFALHDGRLTIHRISQCELQHAEFAYLSACHTTVGDEESPDEVIHLAAAMQFAGFRSVIGTMWTVDDAETKKITPVFYDHMVDSSGRLDHTRAAYALRKTMRSVKMPLDQRILYVHIGV